MHINTAISNNTAQARLTEISTAILRQAGQALKTADEARADLQAKGISITQWAIANKFSPNLVFEVLGGRKKCVRGQAHEIAVKLGLKAGEICTDPARALERRHAPHRQAA